MSRQPDSYSPSNPGSGEAKPQTERVSERLPFLTQLVLLALLIPAHFSVGSLALSPSKVLFLFIVPVLMVNLVRGKYGPVLIVDVMIIGFTIWMTLAMLANHSVRVAVEYTGSNTVNLLGGYLTARATIRTKTGFIALVRFLAFIIVLSLPFAIYETITSRTTIPRILADLPGITSHNDINHDPRLGFWRVQFVFAHPIHYGIFCSLAFSLVYVGMVDTFGRFRRFLTAGIIGFCCFLSVSSGPVLALASQVGLIAWARLMRWSEYSWRVFGGLAFITYVLIEIGSDRAGIYAVVQRLSFNSATAFSRRILFERGIEQIYRTPVLGIGYNPWPLPAWMTGSIDNFWLFLAVTFGLPAFVLFFGAFLVAMIAVGRRNFRASPDLLPLRRAWVFTMGSLTLVLGTVAIWGEIYSIVMFIFGSGIWMIKTSGSAPAGAIGKPKTDPSRQSPRYTRFSAVKVRMRAGGSGAVSQLK